MKGIKEGNFSRI